MISDPVIKRLAVEDCRQFAEKYFAAIAAARKLQVRCAVIGAGNLPAADSSELIEGTDDSSNKPLTGGDLRAIIAAANALVANTQVDNEKLLVAIAKGCVRLEG